jgi:mono/diheme cytochrome c family protein
VQRRRQGKLLACLAGLLAITAYIRPSIAGDATDGAGRPDADASIAKAWRVLRVVDCARCHGKDYTGLAAPSIVGYAATQSRDMFVRMVLDGDPIRGMPGYRSNALVADNIDNIYRYFVARAKGDIGPEYRPPAPAMRS